jgi:hypothetical protein
MVQATGKIKIEGDASSVVDMLRKIDKEMDDTKKKVNNNVESMSKQFRNMSRMVKATFTGGAIAAGVKFTKMLTNSVIQSSKVNLQLEILAKKSKDVYAQLMNAESASMGLANKFDLVQSTMTAMSLGMDLTSGRLTNLITIATKMAAVYGQTVPEAMQNFVTASVRQSKLIADNIGINLNVGTVTEKYAQAIGKTVKELTDQEKALAVQTFMLKEAKNATAEVTKEMIERNMQVAKAVKNLETTWAEAKGSFAIFANDIVAGSQKIRKANQEEQKETTARFNAWKAYNEEEIEGVKMSYSEWESNYEARIEAQRSFRKEEKAINDEYNAYLEQQELNDKEGHDNRISWWKTEEDVFYETRVNMAKVLSWWGVYIKELEDEIQKDGDIAPFNLANMTMVDGKLVTIDQAKKLYDERFGPKKLSKKEQEKKDREDKRRRKAYLKQLEDDKKELIDAIIGYDKEVENYNEKNRVEQIQSDQSYAMLRKELMKQNLKQLGELRMNYAGMADIDEVLNEGNENAKTGLEGFLTTLEDSLKQADRIEKAFVKEQAKNMKHILSFAGTVAVEENKRLDVLKDAWDEEKHLNKLKQDTLMGGKDIMLNVYQALLDGEEAMIPKFLANKAMMYGLDTFWKGISDVAMGFGWLANPFGAAAGPGLIAAGKQEIAVGGALMVAGGVAGALLPEPSDKSKGGDRDKGEASGDRNRISQTQQNNNREVVLNLFPQEKEWVRQFVKTEKQKRKRGV